MLATSSASWSDVNRTYAFFLPSGLKSSEVKISHTTPRAKRKGSSVHLPDEGVDLRGLDVVKLLHRILDLTLVRADVSDEDEGVVLLDLLHGALGVKRVEDDLGSVELGLTGDGDAGVLGRPRELQGLGAVEGGRGANLAGLVKLYRVLV